MLTEECHEAVVLSHSLIILAQLHGSWIYTEVVLAVSGPFGAFGASAFIFSPPVDFVIAIRDFALGRHLETAVRGIVGIRQGAVKRSVRLQYIASGSLAHFFCLTAFFEEYRVKRQLRQKFPRYDFNFVADLS